MKKIKFLGLSSIMLIGTLFSTHESEAKIVRQFAYRYDNGCVGTRTLHSTMFGLFTWETFEWVDCPPGVTPPSGASEWIDDDQA
jgi:hypothetical protein